MSAYFLIAKHLSLLCLGKGTAFVLGLLRPSNNHPLTLQDIRKVEVCSALARRVKDKRSTSSRFKKVPNRLVT